MVSNFFKVNPWFDEERGGIPYHFLAARLNVHKNTLRNWVEREMTPETKAKVLRAIDEIKEELAKAQ